MLDKLNRVQGGSGSLVEHVAQPLQFFMGTNQCIRCDSDITFQRLVGALATHFPGMGVDKMLVDNIRIENNQLGTESNVTLNSGKNEKKRKLENSAQSLLWSKDGALSDDDSQDTEVYDESQDLDMETVQQTYDSVTSKQQLHSNPSTRPSSSSSSFGANKGPFDKGATGKGGIWQRFAKQTPLSSQLTQVKRVQPAQAVAGATTGASAADQHAVPKSVEAPKPVIAPRPVTVPKPAAALAATTASAANTQHNQQ